MPEGFPVAMSPAGASPAHTYINNDGSFELQGSNGTAVYLWPPCYWDDGTARDNSNVVGTRDILEFVRWAAISTPSGQDEGWIFKVKNETFWLFFSTQQILYQGNAVFRLYYSDNGTHFLRWRTPNGTRRVILIRTQDPPISTPPGDISQPPNTTPETRRIDLGRYKKPNGLRFPCPTFAHPLGDTRDEWLKIWIDVKLPNIDQAIDDIKECAVAAAATAIGVVVATDGAALAAAKAAFLAAFKACVQAKLGAAAAQLAVTFEYDTESGKWSGH